MIVAKILGKWLATWSVILVLFWTTGRAENAPQLKVDMLYAEARKVLHDSGWTPSIYAPADARWKWLDDQLRADFLKRGMPEVGSCFGTGDGQCFAIWKRRDRLMVVESRTEGYNPKTGPTVYYFYEVRLHHHISKYTPLLRQDWDPRSADIVPGSFPAGHP